MSKTRLEWKVGLFVFIGLALLAALLIEFSKGLTFFRPTYEINLRSTDVAGLKLRAQVLMAGVQVGTVSDIRLAPSGTNVTIVLRIFSPYEIHKDARFVFQQSGFLGDEYVAIVPTDNAGTVFQNGDVAYAEPPFNLVEFVGSSGDLIKRIEGTVARMDAMFTNINELLLTPETLTNLSAAVVKMRLLSEKALYTLDNVNTLVDSNRPNISLAVSNVTLFSAQLNHVASDVTNLLAANAPVFSHALKNVDSSSETLKALLDDVQAGKGSAGQLLKNEQLANSLSQIAHNLTITSSNLNRLGLWGILWKHKPPKPAAQPSPSQRLTSPKQSGD